MGTKYIIEVEDKPFELLSEDGFTSEKLFRVKGFNSLVFDWNGLNNLTPYTKPDLGRVRKYAYKIGYEKGYRDGVNRIGDAEDKIRKEAYQKGYETGYEDGYNEPGKNQQEAYQRGLADAWEAARKISLAKIDGGFSWESMNNMFGTDSPSKIYKTFTVSEAIEKIRQYEQKQENEFKVGDEFKNEKSGKKFVVLKMNGKEIDRYIDVDGKTYCMTVKYKEMRKTGRHFPEIAAVLEKMRGEQDG